MINVNAWLKTGINALSDNAPALLTAFGAVGVVGTAVLTGKASFEAAKKIADIESVSNMKREANEERVVLSNSEKFKLVWPLYIGPFSSGVLSCGAIVMAHRISSKRAAVLAAAYALNQDKLEEYQDKVKEKFGIKKEKEARDELRQDRVNRDFDHAEVLLFEDDNKVLMREEYTGRFFYANIEDVNRAANEINAHILDPHNQDHSAKLGMFHRRIGLSEVATSDTFGWTRDEPLVLDWSTCVTPDGTQAVHTFDYGNQPVMHPERGAAFR